MGKQLFVSFSSMSGFRKCPRYYYWRHIRGLEKRLFHLPYLVGRVMHHGVQTLLSHPVKAEKEIQKKYADESQSARKEFTLSPYEEEDLAAQEYATVGMLAAFKMYYSKFLKATKHIASEHPLRYQLNKKVVIVGQIDCTLLNQAKKWIWELKNLKSLDMERVRTIKTNPQTALYYEIFNRSVKKTERLDGIIYQIIRKPSIRQKQKESRGEFLRRLQDWYQSSDGGMKFHLERVKGSFIQGEDILNTVDKVSQQMLDCNDMKDYFQDFSKCVSDWQFCQFYGVCHGEDKEKEIKLLTPRKRYRVDEAPELVDE